VTSDDLNSADANEIYCYDAVFLSSSEILVKHLVPSLDLDSVYSSKDH
jgi:hypothetical protein